MEELNSCCQRESFVQKCLVFHLLEGLPRRSQASKDLFLHIDVHSELSNKVLIRGNHSQRENVVLSLDDQYWRAITIKKLCPKSIRSRSTKIDDCFGFASVQIQGQTTIAEQGMDGTQAGLV